jgi:hypothetical protein
MGKIIPMAAKVAKTIPSWLKILIIATLAVSVLNLLLFVSSAIPLFNSKDLLAAFGTLVASFVGAWFAFQFAAYQRRQEKRQKEVSAANFALFRLTQMYSEMRLYQKEVVAPYRGKQDAWLNLHVGPKLNKNILFNVQDLSFVLERNPAVFADVMLEQVRYLNLENLISEHRTLVLSQVWPRLEKAGLKVGDGRMNKEIEDIIGPAAVSQLKVTAAGIIEFTDQNLQSLWEAFKKLRTVVKEIYPDQKFIDFKPLDS